MSCALAHNCHEPTGSEPKNPLCWAWLREKNSLDTKLQSCYRKFSETVLILLQSWQMPLTKWTSGWSWQGAREMWRGDWQVNRDSGLCPVALISSKVISFPSHLPMEGNSQNGWITTSAGTVPQDKPRIYIVVPKPMMVGLPWCSHWTIQGNILFIPRTIYVQKLQALGFLGWE